MLGAYCPVIVSDEDQAVFDALVPFDHWVRRAETLIDFVALRAEAEPFYNREEGTPSIEPILLIKLVLIQFHDGHSDRKLWGHVQTDVAYRWFLGLGLGDHLPDTTTLNKFRARLGSQGFEKLFQNLIKQCRTHGLIRDRLRIKDATHVVADIAVAAGLELVSQARDRLLSCAEPFDSPQVAGDQVRLETIRKSTDGQNNDARLLARIDHLRDILFWTDKLAAPADQALSARWEALVKAREVARKVLAGHDRPNEPGKIRSVVDSDARRSKHGEFYDGYSIDVMIDADSELITAINTYPADGNESADTLILVDQEMKTQGNQIESISIDGAGYDGPMLRKLEEERNIVPFVPDRRQTSSKFMAADFQVSKDGKHLTCPAGHCSQYRQRDDGREVTIYRFDLADCQACPLLQQCGGQSKKFGRSVSLSDYAPEHQKVSQRAVSKEYDEVKQQHPAVERKLGHMMNHNGGRRARYRGLDRVRAQGFMVGMTTNIKRMIQLMIPTNLGLIIQNGTTR